MPVSFWIVVPLALCFTVTMFIRAKSIYHWERKFFHDDPWLQKVGGKLRGQPGVDPSQKQSDILTIRIISAGMTTLILIALLMALFHRRA
ncbi:hypothetical protein [Geothrix alkalitolerans]|uniref:hypothetical protein n=1 Tax=Geothrix alkalitolerans TaxID=2922724 RepID=UPI001FB02745|nr:hypothetical protein [Geothrix alkalitolerans]